MAIVVCPQGEWGRFEESLLSELKARGTPAIVVFNKADLGARSLDLEQKLAAARTPAVETIATTGAGMLDLREALIQAAPPDLLNAPAIVGDLVPAGELVVLVVPIDKEAPKGRLILPQVQTIRDLLDHEAYCMVVKETRTARRPGPSEAASGAGRDRLAGVSQSFGRHAPGTSG